MSNINKTICALPWIHSATDTLGFIRVCCTCQYPYGYLEGIHAKNISPLDTRNHPTLKKIRSNMIKGKEPKECKRCFDRERSGLDSKRINTLRYLNNMDSIIDNTEEDGTINPSIFPIKYYDLRVSNQCNSRCIICSQANSSMLGKLNTWDENLNSKYLQGLIENSKDISTLHLCGGEPLIIKSFTNLLKILKNEANHINLIYNTNLTVLPDEMFGIWKNFRNVKFLISIDGIEDVFEEIRLPTKWKTVKNNLKKLEFKALPNMTFDIVTTMITKNVFYIPELLQWLIEQKFKKLPSIPAFNILYNPKNLSLVKLSESDRLKIVEKYMKFLELHQTKGYKQLIVPFLEFIKNKDNFATPLQKNIERSRVLCQL